MVKSSLLKAAAFFCPQGKAVLEQTAAQVPTTVQILQELQATLDRSLAQHYRQGMPEVEQKIVTGTLTSPSRLGR